MAGLLHPLLPPSRRVRPPLLRFASRISANRGSFFAGAAHELALADKHQFQLWALSMIEAQPYKGGTKGADSGIYGYLYFKPDGKTTEKAAIEVKGGENVSPQWIRALGQVVERERAKIGVLVTLTDPTRTMRREASAVGLYKPTGDQEYAHRSKRFRF